MGFNCKGFEWEWKNIINLCSGTNDAEKTIACFNNGVSAGCRVVG